MCRGALLFILCVDPTLERAKPGVAFRASLVCFNRRLLAVSLLAGSELTFSGLLFYYLASWRSARFAVSGSRGLRRENDIRRNPRDLQLAKSESQRWRERRCQKQAALLLLLPRRPEARVQQVLPTAQTTV